MKYFFLVFAVFLLMILVLAGFRGSKSTEPPIEIFPDMDRQLKYKIQAPSDFFSDGRADRLPVLGTIPVQVPINHPLPANIQPYFYTGKMGMNWGDGIPLEVTSATLERGRERFNINCAVCHGATGSGNGIVSEYGLVGIANFHTDRLRKMSDGQIFDTIAHGRGQMGAYFHIKVEDRWAIISYMRTLQLSQHATLEDVPEEKRGSLSSNPYE